MTNSEIAQQLKEMSAYYEMKIGSKTKPNDPIRFKPRAYERAAEVAESYPEPLEEIFRHGGEKQIVKEATGIGPGIAAHISSMIKTGTFPELAALAPTPGARTKSPVAKINIKKFFAVSRILFFI